jgi:predicted O-methyltransferase YrrM
LSDLPLVFDLPVVPVERLHERLGMEKPVVQPRSSRSKPLAEFKMELDDEPILRALYRHFAPRRHLEFGTWQGAGTVCVLEETQATVWTLNLLEGELREYGRPRYRRRVGDRRGPLARMLGMKTRLYKVQTDAFGAIGYLFLEKGHGHRVCQVYCDSREWDTGPYPAGFFDSCLIDGGHDREVVISDTRKALPLVRAGGLVLWHDFCPVAEVLAAVPSTVGPVEAIRDNWSFIECHMTDLFWVEPSWLLVGVRGDTEVV